MRAHCSTLSTLAFALVAFAAPSIAQAADADTQRARALYDEAGELERQGQWTTAENRLRAALRLRETPQLHFALGWALENNDKLLEARAEYDVAARSARDRAGTDEVVRLATARLVDLEKKIPVLHVRVSGGGKASARVVVDGRDVRIEDDVATAPVNPGSHVVRIERGADRLAEEVVYVGRGSERTVDTDVGDAGAERDTTRARHMRPSAPTIAVGAPLPREHTSGVLPWALIAGGVGLIGGAAALLVSADTDGNEHDALQARWCTATTCNVATAPHPETPEAASLRRQAADASERQSTKEIVGYALGGAGIVGATVGALLLLRGESRRDVASVGPKLVRGGAVATASISF